MKAYVLTRITGVGKNLFAKNRLFDNIKYVGVLAQLAERVVRNHEARSSILLHSTTGRKTQIYKKASPARARFLICCPICCPIRVKACHYMKLLVKALRACSFFS